MVNRTLLYLGPFHENVDYPAVVRTYIEVEVSENIEAFLVAMGYKYVPRCCSINERRMKYEYHQSVRRYHVLPSKSGHPFYVHFMHLSKYARATYPFLPHTLFRKKTDLCSRC